MTVFDFEQIVKYLNWDKIVEDTTVNTKPLTVSPIRDISKVRQQIFIPAATYNLPQPSLGTVPLIVGQYNYTASKAFRISLSGILIGMYIGNIGICIRYTQCGITYRYLLAGVLTNPALVPYALYTNQVIQPNFVIEIWAGNFNSNTITIPVNMLLTTGIIRDPTSPDDFMPDILFPLQAVALTDLQTLLPETLPTAVNPDGPWNDNACGGQPVPPLPSTLYAPVLAANAISTSEIDLTWTEASTDTTILFDIYKSDTPAFFLDNSTLIASNIPYNTLTYQSTGLTDSSQYWYYVVAKNSFGNSIVSNEATAITLGVPILPSAPVIQITSVGVDTIRFSWTASTGSTPITYAVYRGFSSGTEMLINANPPLYNYLDTTLTPNTLYYYKISATNSAGTIFSNEIFATTLFIPDAPVAQIQFSTSNGIEFSWTEDSVGPSTTYRIYRATSFGGPYTQIASGLTIPVYFDAPLSPNTQYWYYIVANDNGGDSANSNIITIATLPTLPQAPVISIGIVTPTSIQIVWNSTTGAASYSVYRSVNADFSGAILLTSNLINLSYTDNTATNTGGQYWYYKVAAVNAAGQTLSNEVNNPLALIPVMTGKSSPSGTANAYALPNTPLNDSFSWNGFTFGTNVDTNPPLHWHDGGAYEFPEALEYVFDSGQFVIQSYVIFSVTGVGASVTYNLQGSNDGVIWTTLDTRTDVGGSDPSTGYLHSHSLPGNLLAFQRFRIKLNAWTGTGFASMAFQLFG